MKDRYENGASSVTARASPRVLPAQQRGSARQCAKCKPAVARVRIGARKVPSLLARYRQRLLRLTNEQRSRHGSGPVRLHGLLNEAAVRHNADLAFKQIRLSHVGHDGARLGSRIRRVGYSFAWAAENLARGQKNAAHAVRSWMLSDGHRKNLLNPRATHIGLHVGRGRNGQLYWIQVFGRPTK